MQNLYRIALIAHDDKKDELIEFIISNLTFFVSDKLELISTATTGSKIQELGLNITCLNSGPMGGDLQIASRVVEGKCDLVLFFRDPLKSHPHDTDITSLLRACDVYNIPIATNPASADFLIRSINAEISAASAY